MPFGRGRVGRVVGEEVWEGVVGVVGEEVVGVVGIGIGGVGIGIGGVGARIGGVGHVGLGRIYLFRVSAYL